MPLRTGLGFAAGGASQGLLDLWKIRLLEQEAEARAQAEKFDQMMRGKDYSLREQEAGRAGTEFKFRQEEAARKAAIENAGFLEGRPEADLPADYRTIGVQTGLAPSLKFPNMPSGQLATPPGMPEAQPIPVSTGVGKMPIGGTTDIGSAPFRSVRPVNIPGVAGVGPTSIIPRSAEQIQRVKQQEEVEKAKNRFYNISEGGTLFMPGTGMTIEGQPKTPPAQPFSQSQNLVDSKGNRVVYQPTTDKYYLAGSGGMTQVPASDVREVPPPRNVDPLAQAIAQERLDAMRKAAEPIDILPDVRTTSLGNKYIDLSSYSPAERPKARASANAAGIAVVTDKALAAKLVDVEMARANQRDLMTDIESTLPKDAQGRLLNIPGITLSKALQTDEARAAYGTWRTTAIGTLKAMVGGQGSGLRINQAEIAQALANDIPQLTDTAAVAHHKFNSIQKQLDNVEKAVLGKFGQAPVQTPDSTQTPVGSAGTSVLGGKFTVKVPGK